MTEYSGERRRTGPVAVLVSRYNELVTGKLLEGAIAAASEAGLADDDAAERLGRYRPPAD